MEKLLCLQDTDILLVSLKLKLTKAQKLIVLAKEGIIKEKQKLADFESSLKEKNAKRDAFKLERQSLDEKVVKYKIQHATLKKNDEYQAMQLTIDRTKAEISKVEEAELELLFELDEMQAALDGKRQECKDALEKIAAQIAKLEADAKAVEDEISQAQAKRESQAQEVPESFYMVYDRLLDNGKKLPLVVKVDDSKCTGCHLKISVSLNYASKGAIKTPVTCEHCGRILYS